MGMGVISVPVWIMDTSSTTLCLKKSSYLWTLCNFFKSKQIFKIFALVSIWNLLQEATKMQYVFISAMSAECLHKI